MSVSPLTNLVVAADPSNYSGSASRKPIQEITVHHMAGVMSAEQCGKIFQAPGRNGSSHYGIGNDGQIANYVDEDNVAWTNSNWESNCRAVTIETSNSETGGGWPVSDAAYESLCKLVADIASRHNMGELVAGQNLTWHSMYAATACPGPTLLARMEDIAKRANEYNGIVVPEPTPAPEPSPEVPTLHTGDLVKVNKYVDYNGNALLKTRDFYYVNQVAGDRVVLAADNVNGTIYAAVNASNLTKVEDGVPEPERGFRVGDTVVPVNLVDYNGTPLVQHDDTYTISNLEGDRAVLVARGAVWAAMNTKDIRRA